MKIVEQSFRILSDFDRMKALKLIEQAARTCYKSECNITETSASDFVRKIAQVKKHESVLEHYSVTILFVTDRGISHELVRHRIASFSQESTRYCNYSNDKFGNEITVVCPAEISQHKEHMYKQDIITGCCIYNYWAYSIQVIEDAYFKLLSEGIKPQIARSVLPNALKTEVVMTANLREWKHILTLRTSAAAHPQMQELMKPLLQWFVEQLPEIFDDIKQEQ